MSYDNADSRPTSFGQYSGVGVTADLKMNGNCLSLEVWGRYRSQSSCYYDSEGLDIDDDATSDDVDPKTLKINFCPFCGRNLQEDKTYIKTLAKTKLPKLKEEKKALKHLRKNVKIIVSAWKSIPATPKKDVDSWLKGAYYDIVDEAVSTYDFIIECPDSLFLHSNVPEAIYIQTYRLKHPRGENAYGYIVSYEDLYPKFSVKDFEESFTGTGNWSYYREHLYIPSLTFALDDKDIPTFEAQYGKKIPKSRIKTMEKVRKEIDTRIAEIDKEIEELTNI